MKKYHYVGLGGTFDHFHTGHQSFLTAIAEQAEHLIIGVTQPKLTRAKVRFDLLEPFKLRCQNVAAFCDSRHIKYEIVPLKDIYGPTLTDKRIQAVFVTPDTFRGGIQINEQRKLYGLPALPIEKVSLLEDEVGNTIASQQIRLGEISRTGTVYRQLFLKTITLSDAQRQFFAQLQGKIVTKPSQQEHSLFRCIVGDTSFETFENNHWKYNIAIIDFKKQRTEYVPHQELLARVQLSIHNPPGSITPELISGFTAALQQQLQLVAVLGEEDLAAVVAVIVLPLGSYVYYGQPGVGMAEVRVTEALKEQFYQVLKT